jgi:antitoxin component YwqK of YwqJK toxin-antitoxin module
MTDSFTGIEREYHLSGQLRSEVFVNNGIREGEFKSYHENWLLNRSKFYRWH